jgi:hypothetical protein
MDERELALRRARIQEEIDTYLQTPDTPEIRLLLDIATLKREIIDIKIELLQTTNADERARKEAKIERKEAKIERKEADIIRKKLLILNLPPAPAGPSFEQIISLSFTSFIFSFYSSTSPRSPTRSSSSKRSGRLIHHHLLSIHLSCVCRFL